MSQPYIGEIRMFGGSFAPTGWAFCAGQLMPIAENDALFVLLGTTYGGDGQETFGLPNLNGRVPIHQGAVGGTTFTIGETAGTESVTLTTNQIPVHNHALLASSSIGTLPNGQSNVLAKLTNIDLYSGDSTDTSMAAAAVTPTGGNQPHDNMQPYLCISYILSLYGIFPTQN